MKITRQSKREARDLYRSCLDEDGLSESRAKEVVAKLLADKPKGYYATVSHFLRLIRLDVRQRTAIVTTAEECLPEQRDQLSRRLRVRYGDGLHFIYRVDPAVIGGMRVQVGSDVYDGTILNRLERLKASF